MREGKCGYGWKKKFWIEGNLESIVAVSEATTVLERTRDLLARIHGDGGHHTEAVGIMQSIEDAEKRVIELRAELDNALQAAQKLKELLARIHRDGGQHTDAVGLQRSCDDADTVLVKWREAFDAAESESARQKSARELLIERLEKMQTEGHTWITIVGVLAMIYSCDLQATKNRERQ